MAVIDQPFTPNDEAIIRDLKREAEKRIASGQIAEEYARVAEVFRLKEAGRSDLAAQVNIVGDRPGLGYDIKSFDNDGRVRFIEVKNISNGRRFFLSEAEWQNSRARQNYWFYLVEAGDAGPPSVTLVQASQLKREHLQPVQHLVRF